MRDTFLLWHDWQRLAVRLGSERQVITVLRCRAQHYMHTLGRQNLVALGAHLGLAYPHLLDTALLRVALNPFYPWGGHVPASISDIALHRLIHATAAGDEATGWSQIRHKVERGTALLQSRLDARDRPGAFRVFRALRAPALLLTVQAWQDPLLDLVSQQGALLLSPEGIIPPLLLSLMARDLGGPLIRLRCPVCRRVLTPGGLCRVHGRQGLYAARR
jgi:hypothetical protein